MEYQLKCHPKFGAFGTAVLAKKDVRIGNYVSVSGVALKNL